jgi:hypothetical protein
MIHKLKAKKRRRARRRVEIERITIHHQSYSASAEGEAGQGRSVTSGWRRADLRPDYSKHPAARQSVGWINAAHLGTLVVVPLRCPGQAVVQAKCLNNRKRGGKITSQEVERKQIGTPFVAIQKVLMKLTPFAIARAQMLTAIELFFADKQSLSKRSPGMPARFWRTGTRRSRASAVPVVLPEIHHRPMQRVKPECRQRGLGAQLHS